MERKLYSGIQDGPLAEVVPNEGSLRSGDIFNHIDGIRNLVYEVSLCRVVGELRAVENANEFY